MPITPNIIHTMKHTVNANVLTSSTDKACLPLFIAHLRLAWRDFRSTGLLTPSF